MLWQKLKHGFKICMIIKMQMIVSPDRHHVIIARIVVPVGGHNDVFGLKYDDLHFSAFIFFFHHYHLLSLADH